LDDSVRAVTGTGLLKYWAEVKARQALGYWVEALYHLCILRQEPAYRRYLAEAILYAEDAGLGLPPSLLGANAEAVSKRHQVPCPSPADMRLRVANLSCGGRREFLVVNPAQTGLDLAWEGNAEYGLTWVDAETRPVQTSDSQLHVAARGWLWGHANAT
jgi:hypothetical protein